MQEICPNCMSVMSSVPDGYKCWTCGRYENDLFVFPNGNPNELTGWSSQYYELPEGAKELQDLIEYKDMNFAIGNIFKACYRMGAKSGTDRKYDLEKIIWFAQRELDRNV